MECPDLPLGTGPTCQCVRKAFQSSSSSDRICGAWGGWRSAMARHGQARWSGRTWRGGEGRGGRGGWEPRQMRLGGCGPRWMQAGRHGRSRRMWVGVRGMCRTQEGTALAGRRQACGLAGCGQAHRAGRACGGWPATVAGKGARSRGCHVVLGAARQPLGECTVGQRGERHNRKEEEMVKN